MADFATGKDDEGGFIKESVDYVWDAKKQHGEINDIYEYLRNHKDQRANDIANKIRGFSANGNYGHLFNGAATVDINHDFVTIETDRLQDNLKAVVVQMMIVNVWNQMIGSDRKKPYLILIDEAWDLLNGMNSAKFIEAVSRTARKYRASLALATQNMTDYFARDNEAARIAFENSAWKFVMYQDEDITMAMKKHDHLGNFVNNLYLESIVKSLNQAKRNSEMIIYGQQLKGIPARLWLDPYSLLLYSTKAQDVMELRNVMREYGVGVESAIDEVLALRAGKDSMLANKVTAIGKTEVA